MRPPSASTSRTRVPLASPPMLGLQLISPMLAEGDGVTKTVVAPRRTAAAAASHPACPPPTTTTSASFPAPKWKADRPREEQSLWEVCRRLSVAAHGSPESRDLRAIGTEFEGYKLVAASDPPLSRPIFGFLSPLSASSSPRCFVHGFPTRRDHTSCKRRAKRGNCTQPVPPGCLSTRTWYARDASALLPRAGQKQYSKMSGGPASR